MKTVEELYKEIKGNDEMKEKFIAAAKENTLADFLKEHGCDASVKDVMDYLKGVKERILSDDELEKVAGGCSSYTCGDTCDYSCCGCTADPGLTVC